MYKSGIQFEEPPRQQKKVPSDGVFMYTLLRTGISKTSQQANTILSITAVVLFIIAFFLFFGGGGGKEKIAENEWTAPIDDPAYQEAIMRIKQ